MARKFAQSVPRVRGTQRRCAKPRRPEPEEARELNELQLMVA